MIRAILFFALILALAAGVAWLADRPGEITLLWLGYQIQTSLMVAALGVAILLVVIGAAWWLLATILRSPQAVSGYFTARRRDRGYQALSRGLIAVGAGDGALAFRASSDARRLLSDEPLVFFLAAQAAQLRGDADGARAAFEAMLARPDTRLLGLHGLFVEARRQSAHDAARQFAEQAVAIKPGLAWAGSALLEYQSAGSDWLGALRTLGTNSRAKLFDKARARRLRAVLTLAQAIELEDRNPEEARLLALEAHRLAPDLVPAAVLAARIATRLGDVRRATRVIETTWKLAPHPELATAYANARPGDSPQDRLKRIEKLAAMQANHREGALALARAAIDARDFAKAREALAKLREEPTEQVCLLMAEIEQSEHGDRGRVRDWLARAVRSPRDPAWMADGQVFEAWAPISPISGRLDAFEWTVPAARLGGPVLADIDPESTDRPMIEVAPIPARPTPKPAPRPNPAGAVVKPFQMPRPASTSQSPKPIPTMKPASIPTVISALQPETPLRPDTRPRPPDDPGPGEAGNEGGERIYRGER